MCNIRKTIFHLAPSIFFKIRNCTSKSAIIRFSQKIGYKGFSEFRFDLSGFLVSQHGETANHIGETSSIQSITSSYSEFILNIQKTCNIDVLHQIAKKKTISAKKIKIFGYNRSFNRAMQFHQRLSHTIGIDVEAVNDYITMSDYASILNHDDLVFIFTTANRHKLYDTIAKSLNEHHCPIICITVDPHINIKPYCNTIVTLPRISKESNFALLDDQPIMMVYIEILLDAIANQMNNQQ